MRSANELAPNDVRPDDGSHPSVMANTSCSSKPNQNTGSEMPATAPNDVIRSNRRCTDASTPTGSATQRASSVLAPTSSSVAGTRSSTRSSTGRPSAKL